MNEIKFKEISGIVFYSTNGRSWIEREGDHQTKYELWVVLGKPAPDDKTKPSVSFI